MSTTINPSPLLSAQPLNVSPTKQSRNDEIIQKFNATLKEAEAKTDEVEAEAKRRDQKNEPVYALLRKNGQVVGAIYRDGLGEYVGNEIGQFWGRSETAEQIANRAKQANIDGLTIEVFGNSD
ncbi:hypothetical protein, partial [Elstera litoralis]|uniref:hypothetical protein n=1 Tax=Elstera litoralis TaxID=552518 RepID=UPI0012ED67E1